METKDLPYEELSKLVECDPETGKLFWLPRPRELFGRVNAYTYWAERRAGREAFQYVHQGYFYGRVLGRIYAAHRVVWILTYRKGPIGFIDHIDGDRSNNSVPNLREVSRQENAMNKSIQRNNHSGCMGVHWHKKDRVWKAYISYAGQRTNIGSFAIFDDAVKARKEAEIRLGFHPNHGRGGEQWGEIL
jgi:hypothetical protein